MVVEKISFVIPCYRSECTIKKVIDEIICVVRKIDETDYEIIAVDDNSPDSVFEVLRKIAAEDKKIKAIRLAKNFGQHSGMMAGLHFATGNICVFVDDDGQCPIDKLEELIAPLHTSWDVSIAKYRKKKQSIFKNMGSVFNEIVANLLIDKPKNIRMGNFMAFKKYVADELTRYDGPYPYVSGLLFRSSAKIINVSMEERHRLEGGTTYTFRKLVALWLNGFTAFSIKPLRFATIVGGVFSISGIVYAFVIIVRKFIHPLIAIGWSSTVSIVLILGGFTLFVLGIIGEYIGRIYMSINGTPQYVIRDKVNIEKETD